MRRITAHLWAICFVGFFSSSAFGNAPTQKSDLVQVPYGKGNILALNIRTARFSIYNNGRLILQNAGCSYRINGKNVNPKGAVLRYTQTPVVNDFGHGTRTILVLEDGKMKAEEIFYTYRDSNYFLTQVRLTGKHLTSNKIIPLEGNLTPPQGDWRSLFVPFDNDTFISYDAKPLAPPFWNNSSEVGVIYDNESRHGFITGSVEHEVWKTGIQTQWNVDHIPKVTVLAGFADSAITRDRISHGLVKGDTICSPLIFGGYFEDWRTGMESYAKANRIAEPPFVYNWTKPTPIGWNSWGVIQEKLSFGKAVAVSNFFADTLKSFRTGGTAYIDLDSYWDKMVKNHTDFSELKAFADSCLAKGLQPGVYWAPFTDWGWNGGANRRVEGSSYTYGELWTKTGKTYHEIDGARAIDPTHPGTLRRIDYFIDKLKACGFKMIKIDFLGHASAESTSFYDTTVTTGMQAYRKGMEYLINRIGDQMFIYAAISPNMATGRYVNSRRIACDAFKTIDQVHYTLNSVTYGWWQTFLYNYIDADHVVLATENPGVNRARFLSSVITGTCFTGDDFSVHGQWSERAKQLYQNADILPIIENGKAFMPIGSVSGQSAAEVFTRKIGSTYYVALFNYSNQSKSFAIDLHQLNIDDKVVCSTDLFTKKSVKQNGQLKTDLPAADATILKISAAGR